MTMNISKGRLKGMTHFDTKHMGLSVFYSSDDCQEVMQITCFMILGKEEEGTASKNADWLFIKT